MAEYIEREAALYRAKSFLANHIDGIVAEHAQLPYETCNATEFARGYERGAIDAVKVVLSTPAADVEVVKHGRWEKRFCHKVSGTINTFALNAKMTSIGTTMWSTDATIIAPTAAQRWMGSNKSSVKNTMKPKYGGNQWT